ncbi:glycoside hydrolase superfamily [Vararia minispora EC-137]|uniref:Glycoside hydrolase superfamily n=1 Tax=Vararia minispora EC-137 TaxID=1314806 RepID=A0ACB8QE96_9AGAM|nr:glycoside hydrolase superfamily [Vararia minispora EC-137]
MKHFIVTLGLAVAALATPTPTTQDAPSRVLTARQAAGTCSGALTKFKFFGVNESGAEFGNQNIPGVLGTDYTWPSPSSIDFFMNQGLNTFRIPFLLERLAPPSTGITGPFDSTYLNGLQTIVNYITSKGGFALVDPHNFMIYNGAQILSTSDFQTFWTNLSKVFINNPNVIFDLMNEPHDIDATVVAGLMQAAINGIRSTGATQLIFAEGTSWTGAWTWTSSGNSQAFTTLSDPLNNTAIGDAEGFADSDGSGTSDQCVSNTIGAERLAAATQWLQQTGFKGFLGEMGAGSNTACIQAVYGALCSMQQAGGVWLGMLWWAAGPWWGTYYQSIEPPSGAAIPSVLPQALLPFV